MIELNDIVGYKNRKIYQDTETFSFCLDSILLSNFVSIRKSCKNILDIGTGNGIIPLVLSLRTDALITGVEIQPNMCRMAKESVKYNKLEDQITIINDDIKKYVSNGNINSFDVITCNPPYFTDGILCNKKSRSIARQELNITLEEIVVISKKLLKNKGVFSVVCRVERLSELFILMKCNNIEPKRIRCVHKDCSSLAKLVLVEGMKNGNSSLKVLKPLFLYDDAGNMTAEYKGLLEEVVE